jgi:hypothetical protein
MEPDIDLTGDTPAILKRLSYETRDLHWKCESCGLERGAPLRGTDVADVKAYIQRKKKKWWQFWIR